LGLTGKLRCMTTSAGFGSNATFLFQCNLGEKQKSRPAAEPTSRES